MGAIGDYVHYFNRNYLRYGINRPGGPVTSNTASSVFGAFKNSLWASMQERASIKQDNELKSLENAVNFIFGKDINNNNFDEAKR